MNGRGRGKIRAPRRAFINDEDVDFDLLWTSLASALREIHTKNASQLSFEQLYRTAYKLVLKKRGETLYMNVESFEKEWLVQEVQPRINEAVSTCLLPETTARGIASNVTEIEKRAAGEKLMKSLKYVWEDHILCMNMTTDILMYMDRVYCTDTRKPSIFTASMTQFRDCVLRASCGYTRISSLLYKVILDQIHIERNGELIDQALIRSCIYMLEGLYETNDEDENMKLYLTSFEPEYLQASRDFYKLEGQTLLRDADAGKFCRHAKKRLDQEADRCRSTLSPLTLPKIKEVVEGELIKAYIKDVMLLPDSGVKFMLDNDRLGDLRLVYDLVSRVDPNKEELKEAIQKHVAEHGSEVNDSALKTASIQPEKDSKPDAEKGEGESKPSIDKALNSQTIAAIKWVDDILILKEKYDKIMVAAFQDDQGVTAAVGRSLAKTINGFERASEFLSLFFDDNMKKGIKGKTEYEVDALLDKGVTLLRYIGDKDMFERYYKKHLSRRLLMKRSASMDAEKQMVSKLKMEVESGFTQKIEKMFTDMALSEEKTLQYRDHVSELRKADPKRPDLDITVLTTTMWPLEAMAPSYSNQTTCIFPESIQLVKQDYEKFYLGQHVGRQLTWQPSMGTADIRAYFPESKGKIKNRELNVSTYAMIILLLFNDLPPGQFFTFEDIQGKTNISTYELSRNLQSLAVAPKTRVLIKEPMSKDIKTTDKFYFNEKFYSQFNKVKIGVVSQSNKVEGEEERKQTERKINDARGSVVEATIVRIMKQRKTLTHQKLITETIQQLASRFAPDINMLKKRIESLIEREYLAREEDSEMPAYRYLA